MITSPTPFLAELAAGHGGPTIPAGKRAYFQQRTRNRVFNFLLEKFLKEQANGLTKAILARRTGKSPEVISRLLGAPSNMTVDSISDLLLGISGEELELQSSSPLQQIASNYSHFNDLSSMQPAAAIGSKTEQRASASAIDSSFNGQNQIPKSSAVSQNSYVSIG